MRLKITSLGVLITFSSTTFLGSWLPKGQVREIRARAIWRLVHLDQITILSHRHLFLPCVCADGQDYLRDCILTIEGPNKKKNHWEVQKYRWHLSWLSEADRGSDTKNQGKQLEQSGFLKLKNSTKPKATIDFHLPRVPTQDLLISVLILMMLVIFDRIFAHFPGDWSWSDMRSKLLVISQKLHFTTLYTLSILVKFQGSLLQCVFTQRVFCIIKKFFCADVVIICTGPKNMLFSLQQVTFPKYPSGALSASAPTWLMSP